MANADIHPPASFLATRTAIAELLTNTALAKKFDDAERRAVHAKKWYTRIGVFSLVAAFLTLVLLAAALTFAPHLREDRVFTLFLGALGALGIGAQIVLLMGPFKKQWLGARFAAERLRALKFEAFASASARADFDLEYFTQTGIGRLDVELDRPFAAMREFDPDTSAIGKIPTTTPSKQFVEIKEAYRALRLDYQIRHAQYAIENIKGARRLPASASEMSFWLGVFSGYLDLVMTALGYEVFEPVRNFVTLTLFVTSAVLFVLERGLSHEAALERYEDYSKSLTRASATLERASTPDEFIACVAQIEEAALRELRRFCREAERSTYLF